MFEKKIKGKINFSDSKPEFVVILIRFHTFSKQSKMLTINCS